MTLLEERHGIGLRGKHCPAWIRERLDQALATLGDALGVGADELVGRLRTEPAELEELAELLRVGETAFYRDSSQWEALRTVVLPHLGARSRWRALSAGCGTGEEAWTLAMLLDRVAPPSGYRVIGQDRSAVALAAAQAALYPAHSARHLPRELARHYLLGEGQSLRIAERLRPEVSFVRRDLTLGPPPGHYELIVCKNLLIYFGEDAGRRMVALLFRALAEQGVLVVAKSEVARVRALGHRAEEIAPGVTVFRA